MGSPLIRAHNGHVPVRSYTGAETMNIGSQWVEKNREMSREKQKGKEENKNYIFK